MSDALLVGLSILRANWDQSQQSYIDNFVPFVADCLRHLGRESVTAHEVQECILDQFGIEMPQAALKTILNRSARRGLVDKRNNKFWPVWEELDSVPLARKRSDVVREIEELVDRLLAYVNREHEVEWSRDHAEDVLHQFVDEWSVPLLKQAVAGKRFDAVLPANREDDYLISSFVVHLYHRDVDGFRYLESLVKGSMLKVGLYLDLGTLNQRFEDLTAYLDTPFLLSLLGIRGKEHQSAAEELTVLARDLGVELACFPDTVSELRGVLQTTAGNLRARKGGSKASRPHADALDSDMSASEFEELADDTEGTLRDLGVHLRSRPSRSSGGSTDEKALEDTLQEVVDYARPPTRQHDATCLASVHEIRYGQVQLDLERARAIFITTNPKVVEAAHRHFGRGGDALKVPVAMLEHQFATLLWLKKPTAAPDLPWKQLVADCHAALNPDDGLWNRYLDAIDDLSERGDLDEQTYNVARFGTEARRSLMEETHGKSEVLSETSVLRIVDAARESIRQPIREEAEQERQLRVHAERQAEEQVDAVRQEADERAREARLEEREATIARVAEVTTRGFVRVAVVAAALVFWSLVAVAGVALAPGVPEWVHDWRWVAAVGLAGATGWGTWSGKSVKQTVISLEEKWNGPVLRLCERLFAAQGDEGRTE